MHGQLGETYFKHIVKQSQVSTTLGKKTYENIVGNGENFFLLQQYFLCFPDFNLRVPL